MFIGPPKLVQIKCNNIVRDMIMGSEVLSGLLLPVEDEQGLMCFAPDAELVEDLFMKTELFRYMEEIEINNIKTFKTIM
ncbi:MAG: hypothetical protein KAS32_30375 [Candidatus Peribacteraceae bacterium]|nr:hypothetical protein [Candidatus Peribacteraceae bacterium]